MITIDRVLSREVPAEWLRDLRAISPVSPAHSYLNFRWYPARKIDRKTETAVDTGRWLLDQWMPRPFIHPDMVRMLEDRPPRLLPDSQRHGRELFVSDFRHEMYRQHKVLVKRWWVLQGDQGGHPAEYTDREVKIRKAIGLPIEPPRIGSLPYAPFDNRVVRQILRYDRLLRYGQDIDRLKASASNEATKREEADAEEQFRRDYVAWLKEDLRESTAFLTDYSRKTEADMTLRPATKAEENAAARLEDEFIATGLVPAA